MAVDIPDALDVVVADDSASLGSLVPHFFLASLHFCWLSESAALFEMHWAKFSWQTKNGKVSLYWETSGVFPSLHSHSKVKSVCTAGFILVIKLNAHRLTVWRINWMIHTVSQVLVSTFPLQIRGQLFCCAIHQETVFEMLVYGDKYTALESIAIELLRH